MRRREAKILKTMIVYRGSCRLLLRGSDPVVQAVVRNQCQASSSSLKLFNILNHRRSYSSKGGRPTFGDGEASSTGRKSNNRVEGSPRASLAALINQGREISLFGPKDPRLPLPGNIGVESVLDPPETPFPDLNLDFLNPNYEDPDIITQELPIERQSRILDQALFCPSSLLSQSTMEDLDIESRILRSQDMFQVTAHSCPELLLSDFRELFPGKSLGNRITVLTICQKTQNDMRAWNPMMEKEREEMMEHFVSLATGIVSKLQDNGFWADFIDPFSGRPMNAGYTQATFWETDERYRKLGFEIDDVGCCRVLRHHQWGTKAFVGSIFTNAPVHSPEVLDLVSALKT